MQSGTRFASPRNVFSRLNSVSIHVSGYPTAARSVLPFITAVVQKDFLALNTHIFAKKKFYNKLNLGKRYVFKVEPGG